MTYHGDWKCLEEILCKCDDPKIAQILNREEVYFLVTRVILETHISVYRHVVNGKCPTIILMTILAGSGSLE